MNESKTALTGFDAKSVFWWLINFLIVVLVIAGFEWGKVLRRQSDALPGRTVSVSAEGRAVVVPDIARLIYSVMSEGEDPSVLQTENTAKMNRAIEFLKQYGVGERDIQTTGYSLSPRYDYDRFTGQSRVYGYALNQTVSVTIRDFGKIGPILGNLPALGVNQIDSFGFTVDDPERHLGAARAQAFAEARKKAEAMAEANGLRLGKVVTFSESGGGMPPPYPMFARGGADMAVQEAPSIQPGSEELKVSVSVTYELR